MFMKTLETYRWMTLAKTLLSDGQGFVQQICCFLILVLISAISNYEIALFGLLVPVNQRQDVEHGSDVGMIVTTRLLEVFQGLLAQRYGNFITALRGVLDDLKWNLLGINHFARYSFCNFRTVKANQIKMKRYFLCLISNPAKRVYQIVQGSEPRRNLIADIRRCRHRVGWSGLSELTGIQVLFIFRSKSELLQGLIRGRLMVRGFDGLVVSGQIVVELLDGSHVLEVLHFFLELGDFLKK